MKCKLFIAIFFLMVSVSGVFAQLGIKAGVNMANEINSFSQTDVKANFFSSNLTGFQIGLVYQGMLKKSGFGVEIGALLSQKGSVFIDSTSIENVIKKGYKELNYLEIPFNVRYRLSFGVIGVYGFGGVYGGYELSGKTIDETTEVMQNETFSGFRDHIDYGYNFGAGVELYKKIQLGLTWSEGIKNTAKIIIGLPTATTATNRVISINLVYLF